MQTAFMYKDAGPPNQDPLCLVLSHRLCLYSRFRIRSLSSRFQSRSSFDCCLAITAVRAEAGSARTVTGGCCHLSR